MDTDTPTTDIVIIDAEIVDETDSFGSEITKTVATSAATSAVLVGAYFAFSYLKPRVIALLSRTKETVEEEVVPLMTDAPDKKD